MATGPEMARALFSPFKKFQSGYYNRHLEFREALIEHFYGEDEVKSPGNTGGAS